MAKHKRSARRPQPRHKEQKKSQHDKHERLQRRNLERKKTTHARVSLIDAIQIMVSMLQAVIDRRIAFRLAIVIGGMLIADDRRTASAWFVAAGVQDDWDRFYDCLIRVGQISAQLATVVLGLVVQKSIPGLTDRILFPGPPDPHRRGRRSIYGKNKISLAKRAAHRQGWETLIYRCRRGELTRQYKTFLATSQLVSGQIRVVIVRFEDGG